jgi:competence protein ComEA
VTTPASATTAQIVVDVGGRVRHPGLVTLPAGSRVADAIAAAGGAVRAADLARINLAARVSDGQLLLVGVPGASAQAGGGSGPGGGPVYLNAATVDQLDALPGVGPVLAQRIVDWRQQHGGFRSVDDLQQVPGIGARKFSDLKALVAV